MNSFIGLVLVFGMWINPAQVASLKDSGKGCYLFLSGTHYTYVENHHCDEVAKILNKFYEDSVSKTAVAPITE